MFVCLSVTVCLSVCRRSWRARTDVQRFVFPPVYRTPEERSVVYGNRNRPQTSRPGRSHLLQRLRQGPDGRLYLARSPQRIYRVSLWSRNGCCLYQVRAIGNVWVGEGKIRGGGGRQTVFDEIVNRWQLSVMILVIRLITKMWIMILVIIKNRDPDWFTDWFGWLAWLAGLHLMKLWIMIPVIKQACRETHTDRHKDGGCLRTKLLMY